MKEVKAKSILARGALGLALAIATLAAVACGGDDMPVPGSGGDPVPGGGDMPPGGGDCGGIVGWVCPSGKYCDFAGNCGLGDMLGTCKAIPDSCSQDCSAMVCGCDGIIYCNACLAHFAGVDETADASCTTVQRPVIPPP